MPAPDGGLTAAEIAAIYALVQAQSEIRRQLAEMAIAAVLGPLRIVNWYDPVDVALAVERVLRIVQPIQTRAAQVTDAYLARTLTLMTGRPVRPVGTIDVTQLRRVVTPAVARIVSARPPVEIEPEGDLDLDDVFEDEDEDEDRRLDEEFERQVDDELRAIEDEFDQELERELAEDEARLLALDPMEPYIRIGSEYRWRISEGTSETEALERALARAADVADMDVALAQRAQEHEVMIQQNPSEITGYRRILLAELRNPDSPPCGLCVVAADRIYKREELKPIHDRCRCGVLAIRGPADPGLDINGQDLDRIYKAAGGTHGRKLKKLRVAIGEHGEIGPILLPYGKGFRDAEEADRDGRAATARRRLPGLERSTTGLQRRLDEGETRVRPLLGYQQRLIEQLRAEIGV
ncbi:hypothetical protein I0C86_41405 [Plantactinospora sp. S1510]|uniref:DUF222 domain-containing protein n=1 Tax=Plantactinospora alkalitolerans TaxID=2789879 RepID=A0ABS0HA19_9ACTN|nr:hypothetical protein [Plantactinospora alkalitolerans]MBF9135310.1 hypothetical protein [Plantactinospora alkalitolerans]